MNMDMISNDDLSLILNDRLIDRIKKFNKYLKKIDEVIFNYIVTVNLRIIIYNFINPNVVPEKIFVFSKEMYTTLNNDKTFVNQIADFNIYIHSMFPATYLRTIKDHLIESICVLYKSGIKSKEKKIYDKAVNKVFDEIDYFWIILLMKYIQLYE